MTCDRAQQLLLDGGEDDVPALPGELADARIHLAACAECRLAVEQLLRYREALREFDPDAQPSGGWSSFQDGLVRRITDFAGSDHAAGKTEHRAGVARRWAGDPAPLSSRGWRHPRARRALVGAAACMFFFAGGFWTGRHGSEASADISSHLRADADANATTFREIVDRTGPADWMLFSDGDLSVSYVTDDETTKDASSTDVPGRLLVLQLTTLSRETTVSDARLVIVPGRTARIAVPVGKDRELEYLIATTADAVPRLSLWVDLKAETNRSLATLGATALLRPGAPTAVGQLATSTGPYEVRVTFFEPSPRAKAGQRAAAAATPTDTEKGML